MNRQEALTEARLCIRSAEASGDPEHRRTLLELARWWSQQVDQPARPTADCGSNRRGQTIERSRKPVAGPGPNARQRP
jgi:hypothetical protein